MLDALNEMKNAESDSDSNEDGANRIQNDNFVMADIGKSLDKRKQEHSNIGERAALIKYKKDLSYQEFSEDPFGKIKLAKKEEARLQAQIAREMKSKAQQENGEKAHQPASLLESGLPKVVQPPMSVDFQKPEQFTSVQDRLA